MKDAYVIMDADEGRVNRLFSVDSGYIPWIIHSFTDELRFARRYPTKEAAQRDCDRFMKERYDFDGSAPLEPGRLRVMRLALVPA